MAVNTSILCIANQKGGVAKTTTVVNLAAAFSMLGKRVLVIDADYQGNATDSLGIKIEDASCKNLAIAITGELSADQVCVRSNVSNVDVIAGTRDLDKVREKMSGTPQQHLLLKPLINESVLNNYDIVIIDTHPTLDCIYMSSMAASHYYLIPVFPEPESAKGLVDMVHSADTIRRYLNPLLCNLGTVICRYEKNFATHPKFVNKIRDLAKLANIPVCQNIIPQSASISASSSASQPVVSWKPNSVVSTAYLALAAELLPSLKGRRLGRVPVPNMEEAGRLAQVVEASIDF